VPPYRPASSFIVFNLTRFLPSQTISSNQSNRHWFDKASTPHWQCSSAPSSVNRMYFFGHVKASNTFLVVLEMNHLFLPQGLPLDIFLTLIAARREFWLLRPLLLQK
jgi:hypothetical protein